MDVLWVNGYEIRVTRTETETVIAANREGLLSLSNILTALANEPLGSHLHLDENNALEDGSSPLILENIDRNPGL